MSTMTIPLKGGVEFKVDSEMLKNVPEAAWNLVIIKGLQAVLGLKMSKIGVAGLEGAELETARKEIQQVAENNLNDLVAGKVRGRGAPKQKGQSAIKTEAVRLAKLSVKAQLKAAGLKITSYSGAELTAAAKGLVETDPSFMAKAEANLAAASEQATGITLPQAFLAKGEKAKPVGRQKKEGATPPPTKGKPAQQARAH